MILTTRKNKEGNTVLEIKAASQEEALSAYQILAPFLDSEKWVATFPPVYIGDGTTGLTLAVVFKS